MGEILSEKKENMPILLHYHDHGDINKRQAGGKKKYFLLSTSFYHLHVFSLQGYQLSWVNIL